MKEKHISLTKIFRYDAIIRKLNKLKGKEDFKSIKLTRSLGKGKALPCLYLPGNGVHMSWVLNMKKEGY